MKHINAFYRGEKVPRKVKKACLSRRLSSTQLRLKIEWWLKYGENYNTFCPNCGEGGERLVDHGAEYPERWVTCYCLRCGKKTSESDNSPFYHVLEDMREDLLNLPS